jgi:hypothetical protein
MPIGKELLEQVLALSDEDFDELRWAINDRIAESDDRFSDELDAMFYRVFPYEDGE